MQRKLVHNALLVVVLLALVSTASAAVRLPAVFSDHMIVQRDQAVPVWGWAEPGKEVTVSLAGQSASAKAGADGRFKATLPKLAAGGPHVLTVAEAGGASVTLKDVLVGEVWLCSGQSNMEWPVAASLNSKEEVAAAEYPQIRLFNVQKKTAEKPLDDCQGKWAPCSPESVPGFSAVGYFFIRQLHKDLGIPCGMIGSSWGGTPAESWTSREALESDPSLQPILARWANPKPDQVNSPYRPTSLYNGMLAPVIPYALRGWIWYQGESNCGRAYQYRTLFPLMIRNWREAWGQGDLAFGLVQLAPYKYDKKNVGTTCAELREAQTMTVEKVPHVGMAVTMDIGDVNDIHPKNKQEVGRRLGLWAEATVYGKDVPYSGPIYKSMAVEDGKVRILFDHAAGGLKTRDGKAPSDFVVAGEDQQFHPAVAVIDGQSLVVSSDKVAKPAAVRYGWRDDAEPNLSNSVGLPASPFRTDSWKGVTDGNR